MIHSDIQNQLQFLIKTSAPPLIEVADHAASSAQWMPGQRLPAHVLANLPNGRFEVRVGDQILDLNLPRNTQPGDNIELLFIGDKPRLTFALSQDLAALAMPKTQVTLSEAARFLGALLQKGAADGNTVAQTARLVPVLPGPPADTASFAQALRQALSHSGLFYESHQAQWAGGERSLAALLQEPQGRLSPLLHASQGGTDKVGPLPGQLATGTALANTEEAGMLATGMRGAGEVVHPQATQLVQQQLHVLDSRQLVWQGLVWPGQHMRWEIGEDGARTDTGVEDEDSGWQARLSLELPTLGGISARLAFSHSAVRLDIVAELGNSAELMRSQQALLAQAMQEAGIMLSTLCIRHGECGEG